MAAENAERSGWISYLETRPLRSRGQSKDVAPQQALQPIEQYMEFDHLGPVNDPLVDRNIDLLIEDAKRFYRGFPDEVNGVIAPTAELDQIVTEEMFVRGALLAQRRQNLSDPPLIQSSNGSKSSPEESGSGQEMERPQLNMVEYRSLQKEEASHFKDQTKTLNVILLTCCVGGIVQGWSQAGMAGANLSWPCELPGNIGNKDSGSCRPQRLWVFNGVNAATYFSGCFSVWLSDLLNDKFYGRRGALMIAATFTFCGSIWSGYAYTWRQLLGARLILGIGYGAKVSVVTIFESEVAPSKRRGRVLVSWQTFTALGIFLGIGANLIYHWHWRLQVSSSFIPCFTFIALAWACSESPRWLIKKERYKDAFIVLRDLRGTDLQAARDLYFIYAQLRVEMRILAGKKGHPLEKWENYLYYQLELLKSTYTTRLKQVFSVPRNRRAALASSIVMASQQLTGINIFSFLAATALNAAGSNRIKSLWIELGWAGTNTVFSAVAYWFIDTKGRRSLLIFSLATMVPLLIGHAFVFVVSTKPQHGTLRDGIVGLLTFLIVVAYSPGAGVVPFLYSSEVFTMVNREAGMSLSCFVNFLLGCIIIFFIPLSWTADRSESINSGPTRLLLVFTGLDFAAAVLVWFLVPETNLGDQSALEHMNYLFSIPTRAVRRYHALKLRPRSMRPEDETDNGKLPPTLDEWWKAYGRGRYSARRNESLSSRDQP